MYVVFYRSVTLIMLLFYKSSKANRGHELQVFNRGGSILASYLITVKPGGKISVITAYQTSSVGVRERFTS